MVCDGNDHVNVASGTVTSPVAVTHPRMSGNYPYGKATLVVARISRA